MTEAGEDSSRGGLLGLSFKSRCPPDIQPNTRLIAVCGVTDYRGTLQDISSSEEDEPFSRGHQKGALSGLVSRRLASPREDGWFLSDFYMYQHLFRGLGANQIWITCESPRELVKRYGEYGHGDGKEDHRVVLDKNLLPTIEKDGNIRVFKPADLLQDFLRTFQDECKIADQLQQPVVLMVFGHGDQNTYGIAIGGRGDPANAPRLQIHHIVASLRGLNVSFTMLLTSCYSGGWLLQPNLNVSGLTAAGPRSPSLSWPATLGGRSHGSIYSTAVREALTKMESENATQIHPHSSGEILDEEKQSSTYAELCNVIHSTLLHDVDRFGHFHDNRFSAQNDMWELEWRRRSGLPLAAFEAQWEKLPRMIPQPGTSLRVSKKGGLSLGSSSTAEVAANGPYGLHPELNKSQAHRIIKDMAYGYLCSHPPIDNGAPDRLCNTTARALMRGDPVPSWKMRTLKDALTYRIGMTKFATEYKNVMGLDFMDCDKFDFELWLKNIHYGATKSKEKWTTYMKSLTMIDDARVFDQPLAGDGWAYTKPASYLAVAAVECGLSTEALAEAVAKVLTWKAVRVQGLAQRVRVDRSVRLAGSKAFNSARSISPLARRASQ